MTPPGGFEDRNNSDRDNNNNNNTPSMGRHAARPEPVSPPDTPVIDRKLQHFLQDTVDKGPRDHIDKAMDDLIMEKYQPVYPWLKPGNAQFLRSVLTTFLEHKGAQVEMDLRDASEQAAYEWDEQLHILSMELKRLTGSEPRIVPEGNNQWGIYSKAGGGGGMSDKEKERKRQINKKAFSVSADMG
jgi:hypothetical protein